MANRNARLITKNSDIVNRPLPSSLLAGEAIVNTADGIVWYSGVTTSTNEWTPAGTGTTANFFEVGSNLYDLRLRNQITEYQGASGAGLIGKFLSGTTSGFVLADISSIQGVDSYVTGGTFSNSTDTLTLNLNEGKPDVTITGITDYFTTGATLIGTTAYFNTNASLSAYTLDLSSLDTNDTFVTGATYDDANTFTLTRNDNVDISVSFDTVTGLTVNGTLSATTLDGNDILSGGTNLLNVFSNLDTFVTGLTYSNSILTIARNQGLANLTTIIDSVTGLTVGNLTAGRIVYVGSGGELTDEAGFTYNDSTNTLEVANITTSQNVVISGNLTVLGSAVSAFTGELYIEDNNVILNYNPTGTTNATSINSGFVVQDGDGASNDVSYQIVRMENLTGLTATQVPDVTEYSSATGYLNRGWITELNDIVIRSTDATDDGTVGSITGVRVLAEFDILDGGTY